MPSTRHVRLSHGLSDAVIARLLDASHVSASNVLPIRTRFAPSPMLHQQFEVLWRLGLASGRETLLPPFTAGHSLGLVRWPDFDRLTHTPAHVKLAARLVRRPYTIEELANAAEMPAGEVRSFVNAAALCGLIEITPSATPITLPVSVETVRSPATAPRQQRGILNRFVPRSDSEGCDRSARVAAGPLDP